MNNYNYINYDWYRNVNNSMNYFENVMPNNQSLMNPKVGFEKGNMFFNLYNAYKNYMPQNLVPQNAEEKDLFDLLAITFAAHEINLYLDTHPNDESMIMLFNDYSKQKERLTKQYEQKYGPLTVYDNIENSKGFKWVETKWPWEVENV